MINMRWQNLKDHKTRHWLHGRAWFKIGHIEWVLGHASFGTKIAWPGYDDEAVEIMFGCGLFALYSSWGRCRQYKAQREIAIDFHNQAMWWNLGAHEDGEAHKWQRGSFHPLRFLFGKQKVAVVWEKTLSDLCVPMPEANYSCTVELKYMQWKRPRLLWSSHRGMYADVKIPNGVPIPGKGESSWDCGEDAIFALHSKARTAEEGIGNVVASALESREKHGGKNWKPELVESDK